jgi:hypothetical protein
MNKMYQLITGMMVVVAAIAFSACKKSFDSPPGAADPNLVANTSIKALKALHTTSGALDVINSDLIISGVVVADDKSGNLYKQLFIQDSTGGLQVLLDANSLHGTYPVGRRIFIKCNGLCISDNNRTMQLGIRALVGGIPSIEAIPSNLISRYVVGGSLGNPVVPKVLTLAQLGGTPNMQDPYIGSLVQLDNYAFTNLNATYSDTSAYRNSINLDLKSCANENIIIRTSGFANFAGQRVAQGRGSLVAIYTVFGNTKQFLIRDTNDVKFTNPYACPLPPGTLLLEDFESIGANNATLNIPGWKNIGETGGIAFQNAVFGSVKCAKASAFSTGAANMVSWLITPAVNLTGTTAPKLTFTQAAGFALGSTNFQVLVSTNYTGSNTPSTATWTQVYSSTVTTPTSGFGSFASVGNISLNAYIGQTVHIAFRYTGGDPGRTTTYQIDDVRVTAL